MNKTTSLLTLTVLLVVLTCARRSEVNEKILVKIDDESVITVNEFIARAEYMPRPDYCRQNSYIDKKIVLNSLIAEKLLAKEAGLDNPPAQNEGFQLFLKGRREQAMRQWMHNVEATTQVVLDSAEIKKSYNLAGREYELAYFSISDSSQLQRVQQAVDDPSLFDALYHQLIGDDAAPRRKVNYAAPEHLKVHAALFSEPLKIGQVLPPIKIADDDYLIIKVLGWSDDLAITERQQQERLDKVREKLTQVRSAEIWNRRVAEIMRGKRLDFNPEVFRRVSQLMFSVYFKTDEERRDQLADKIWDLEEQEMSKMLENLPDEEFRRQPLFQVDGQVWTVADFQRALHYHPLVFRQRRLPSERFAKELRLAIADLVRDEFVTREAYKKGYDKVPTVERHVAMWRDAYLALYQRTQYLKSIGETRNFNQNYHEILTQHLNPYVREQFNRHYKKIEMDFDAFENIALTSIDLFVKQPDQPFKYVVPNFPILTSEHLIDYVAKMRP